MYISEKNWLSKMESIKYRLDKMEKFNYHFSIALAALLLFLIWDMKNSLGVGLAGPIIVTCLILASLATISLKRILAPVNVFKILTRWGAISFTLQIFVGCIASTWILTADDMSNGVLYSLSTFTAIIASVFLTLCYKKYNIDRKIKLLEEGKEYSAISDIVRIYLLDMIEDSPMVRKALNEIESTNRPILNMEAKKLLRGGEIPENISNEFTPEWLISNDKP